MIFKGADLETERLLLKTVDESEAQAIVEFYLRNRKFLEPWEPLREESFFSVGVQADILQTEWEAMIRGQMIRWWLFKKENGLSRTIGNVGIANIVRGVFQSCHLGYKIDQNEANQGYMTEALKAVIGYAFQQLKLHRIEANVIPGNEPSMRLAQKLGFQHEGLASKYLKINGKWQDHIHMALLNEAMD